MRHRIKNAAQSKLKTGMAKGQNHLATSIICGSFMCNPLLLGHRHARRL